MPGPGGHHGGPGGPGGGRGGFGGPRPPMGGGHPHRPPMGGGPRPPMGGGYHHPYRYRRGCGGCLMPVIGVAALIAAGLLALFL